MQLYEKPRDVSGSFAMPGDGVSFLERLAETTTAVAVETALLPLAPLRASQHLDELGALTAAAEQETLLARTVTSRHVSMEEAAAARIRKLQEATGVQLENPIGDGYYREARDRVIAALDIRSKGFALHQELGVQGERIAQEQRNIFNERMNDVLERFPDKAAAFASGTTLEQEAGVLASSAEDAANAARTKSEAAGVPWVARMGAEFAGGLYGSRRDPLFIASLFAGPSAAVGKTAASRITYSAITNGLVNAGAQALAQPSVQAWRAERGREHGILPALEEVGFAFLLGAIPGAGIQGVSEALRRPLTRIARGEASLADAEAAAKALGVQLDPDTARALAAADRSAAEERLLAAEKPNGVRDDDHNEALAAALRAETDPNAPPPVPYRPVPEGATGKIAEDAVAASPTPVEALARLKENPELRISALASDDPEIRAAGVLAHGSDELLGELESGRVSPGAARATIDAGVPELDQAAVARRVEDARAETVEEMRALAANEIREPVPRADLTRAMPELPEGVALVGEGENGPVLRGFKDRFDEAIAWLRRAHSGDALEVIALPARPDERVDLIAGEAGPEGYGVRHIDSEHPGDLDKLPSLWPDLKVREEGATRIVLESAAAKAVIVKNFAGAEKRWLLTFFERKTDRSGSGPIEGAVDKGPALPSPDRPAADDLGRAAPDGKLDPTARDTPLVKDSSDPLDLVPVTRDDGTVVLVSADAVEQAGARSEFLSELVKGCKG